MRLNTNIAALTAYNALNATGNQLQKTVQRLSTGLRINSASDDAAGLAISEKMRAQTAGLDMAQRNAQDGISMLQTAEGAISSTQSILQRMRELAVQAANDTLTANDRSFIQLEIDELKDEVNRIANTTQFNGKRLLDGSGGALWSTSDLGTKAFVRGGLVSFDQFNQKIVSEGNYNIEIRANPGAAQVQKTGIFTIEHKDEFPREETVRVPTTKTVRIPVIGEKTEPKDDPVGYCIYLNGAGNKPVGGSLKTGDPLTEAPNIGELERGWSPPVEGATYVDPESEDKIPIPTYTLKIKESGTYYIKGTPGIVSHNHIEVAEGVNATIMLDNVNIDVSNSSEAAIKLGTGATANIYLKGNNELHSGSKRAGIETTGATLILSSADGDGSTSGSLIVTGGAAKLYPKEKIEEMKRKNMSDTLSGAGIGGGYGGAGGNITIKGGHIEATGGSDAAGIGGAWRGGNSGNIHISGGDVKATAGYGWHPAGIGSGCDGTIEEIIIDGGKVEAIGGSWGGAGIGGGGLNSVASGTIKVRTGLCNPDNPKDESYAVVAKPGSGAEAIGVGSAGGSVTEKNLNADIPAPTYNPAPDNWPVAESPSTELVPYVEYVSETVDVLTEYKRTVIDENHARNSLSDVVLNGAVNVEADNLPEGNYTVRTLDTPLTESTAALTGEHGFATSVADLLTVDVGTASGLAELAANANILFEVTGVDKVNRTVTLKATANLLELDGTVKTRLVREDIVLTEGTAAGLTGLDLRGILAWAAEESAPAATLTLGAGAAGGFSVGNKFVYNFTAASSIAQTVEVSGTQGGKSLTAQPVRYGLDADAVAGTTVRFSNFYLDSTGTVYEGEISLTMDDTPLTGDVELAAFRTGRLPSRDENSVDPARPDTKLSEIRKFYNANGVFMLDAPQTITVFQGDGRSTSVTLYANDTIEDVRSRLNSAIANDLGQAQHVRGDVNRFVTYVEKGKTQANGLETVEGTFVIRSAIPGHAGELSFSGDRDLLNALALNTIQESTESRYTASVYNAHTGAAVATNVNFTGNQLLGVIHENIDLEFDAMSGITANWSENTKNYILSGGQSNVTVHLADNSTVLQVGANRGEDFYLNIGDMSADALGVARVNVATKVSAVRAIGTLDRAINRVSAQRAKIGAYQNSLEYTIENLQTTATNLTAAESRIRDADMAKTMMEFVKLQILNQSGTSMLAQANQLPQQVLSLLQ